MTISEDQEIILNDVATRSFRNVADQDYIAARLCYRSGLMLQFLWMAQQTIEKYLKAILLYNRKKWSKANHDLHSPLAFVESIKRIGFTLSDESRRFIAYIDMQGDNRYLSQPHYTKGGELPILDKCVWELRLYCQDFNYDGEQYGNLGKFKLQEIRDWRASDEPHEFRLIGGYLEKVLKERGNPRREPLVWQNLYYGLRKRNSVTIPRHTNAVNPPHTLHPEHFEFLAEYMFFPGFVKKHFEKMKAEGDKKAIRRA